MIRPITKLPRVVEVKIEAPARNTKGAVRFG
jgi:hypothetical protein